MLRKHENALAKNKLEATLNELSMLSDTSVHHAFSKVGVYLPVYIYAVLGINSCTYDLLGLMDFREDVS